MQEKFNAPKYLFTTFTSNRQKNEDKFIEDNKRQSAGFFEDIEFLYMLFLFFVAGMVNMCAYTHITITRAYIVRVILKYGYKNIRRT